MGYRFDGQDMRIMILSTPKTGNTWLKNLLSSVYHLPMRDLPEVFDESELNALGSRWIGHEHYPVDSKLLEWIRKNRAVVLTTIRHPADAFLSLYHYVRNFQGRNGRDFGLSAQSFVKDDESFGPDTQKYIRRFFPASLNLSIMWIHSGLARIVRYEDLWRDPIQRLQDLTKEIYPVSLGTIERAVERADIQLLRASRPADAQFFRSGTIGQWRERLPPVVLETFKSHPPYPAQFSVLGYSMDPEDPVVTAPPKLRPQKSSVASVSHFDNGAAITAILKRIYLSFDGEEASLRWPSLTDTRSKDSFHAWLNSASDEDPEDSSAVPIITNLAACLYAEKHQYSKLFPDLYGSGRVGWLFWFINHGRDEFDLDEAFLKPVRESLLTWCAKPAIERSVDPNLPAIPHMAYYAYRTRQDLQDTFPALEGDDRIRYLHWFSLQGVLEYKLQTDFSVAIRASFNEWANESDPKDSVRSEFLPAINRFAAYVYRTRQDLRTAYPDAYGQDRLDFLTSLFREYPEMPDLFTSVMESWAKAARICRSASNDPHA